MFSITNSSIFGPNTRITGPNGIIARGFLPPPSQSDAYFASQLSTSENIGITQIAGPRETTESNEFDFEPNTTVNDSFDSEPDIITLSPEEEKSTEPPRKINPFAWKTFDFERNETERVESQIDEPDSQIDIDLSLNGPNIPIQHGSDLLNLIPVTNIPSKYRRVFSIFPYFNIVQSKVFNDVFFTEKPLVVCAPTGSGKTVIFELAIVRFLHEFDQSQNQHPFKIIYMAPIKALCSERQADWSTKFGQYGLQCVELTGDSDFNDYLDFKTAAIILTTPEKWDSITRRWRDNVTFVANIVLFLIDEIHLLNDKTRGATMEVVITRMKTVHSNLAKCKIRNTYQNTGVRFVGVSATVPNAEDIAKWLSCNNLPGVSYKMDESLRPVTLKRIVLGYSQKGTNSEFKFDLSLSYKLPHVIHQFSEYKPTIVFCSTRKSVVQTASILSQKTSYVANAQHKQKLTQVANTLRDNKLRDLVMVGIGFHHAGLDMNDRKKVEGIFLQGELMVLISTSTLAMGVNFPAHLVIIKSTTQYVSGSYQEYSETQILQMIGRAGRPQFDNTATAVIMTDATKKEKYERLVNGTQLVESGLHKNLIEHLNAEIALQTITDLQVALEWIKATFLYIRVTRNPKYYGIPEGLTMRQIEQKLSDMCGKDLNALASINLIKMDENLYDLKPLEAGRLMARYCVTYDTMKKFHEIDGLANLNDLLITVSSCSEFQDIQLRINERKILNTLNKDKHSATIRFPMTGRIKSPDMKINCLIQTSFGCLPLQEFSLNQDSTRIMRVGQRISKCLSEYIQLEPKGFRVLVSAVTLSKCFRAKLWENSNHISKQMDKIGPTFSNILVQAGLTSFQKIIETDARQIEMLVGRHPPFGSNLKEAIQNLPKYNVKVEQGVKYSFKTCELCLTVEMTNVDLIRDSCVAPAGHGMILTVGDCDNNVVVKNRVTDWIMFKNGHWVKKFEVQRAKNGDELTIQLISEVYVGMDVNTRYIPFYFGATKNTSSIESGDSAKTRVPQTPKPNDINAQPCNHRCLDKSKCRHVCCKMGQQTSENLVKLQSSVNCEVNDILSENLLEQNSQNSLDDLRNKFEYTRRNKRVLEDTGVLQHSSKKVQFQPARSVKIQPGPTFKLDSDSEDELLTKEVLDCMNDENFFDDLTDLTNDDFQFIKDELPELKRYNSYQKVPLHQYDNYQPSQSSKTATVSKPPDEYDEIKLFANYDPEKEYQKACDEFETIFGHVFDE